MKLSRKVKGGLVIGALSFGVIGGAFAYYSGTAETTSNTFNIVAGESNQTDAGTVQETGWNPENAKDLQPGQTVTKDPSFTSNVDYEAWVFLKVEIPTISARMEGDSEDKVYDSVILNGIDAGKWTKINETVSTTVGENSIYIYGYNEKLAARETTDALFESFTIPDFIKSTALTDSIDVSGSMIQTTGYDTVESAAEALGLK